ncbi:MAG: glycosyltransferase family 2 protein [Pseudobutyrivibrio sp.]|nr:glycosyltransferase family 2 protein [Pseudobutyrivibrio sp.]MCF0185528.1 glycosyltransferase family 2 protein [Bacteroidaceae bacterium]
MTEEKKKTVSIMIPCFNEVENIVGITGAVVNVMTQQLPDYDYEIVIIDNASTDGTRDLIRQICEKNKKIKAIFNVTNFGQFNSPFHGMCETTGDCTITMCADFQDPPELIPVFVEQWEKGHRIVSGVKTSSKENPIIYKARSIYYKLIKNMSTVQMIEHFTGFGLYDKTFISLLRELDDPIPFIRGIVAEYGSGFNLVEVEYEQPQRAAGKTHNNFYSLYDAAMLSFTSYTKVGLRIGTFVGFFIAFVSFLIGIVYLVYKLVHWNTFDAGMAPLTIGMFFLGGVILAFLGFMGEYILNINTRVIHRPIVVEELRLNFEEEEKKSK